MTWLVSWPAGSNAIPQYAAHDTEQRAEAHARELVNSKRTTCATVFWSEGSQPENVPAATEENQ